MTVETVTKFIKKRSYAAASALTCLVMLAWSAYDSPLYPLYTSGDSSIFMLIGKGITEGKIPYKDLFDHKGPVLFWIEALGWAIGGRTGIWLIETLCAVSSVLLIMQICRKLNADFLVPTIGTAIVYLSIFGRGNLCENYSLPLVYLSLLFVVKYYKLGITPHPPAYAYIYGICFGLLAFIRVNNATVICAFILVIMIRLIAAKEFGNLAANLFSGLLGILTVAAPICLYFYLYGALEDMIFCTFTYNFIYTTKIVALSGEGLLGKAVTFMPITFTTVYFGHKWLTRDVREHGQVFYVSFFSVSAMYLAELLYTNMSGNYHTPALPLYSVFLATAFPVFRPGELKHVLKERKFGVWAAGAVLITCLFLRSCLYNLGAPIYRHYLTDACSSRYKDVQECIAVIPEEERDSVIGYEISTSWYIDSGITPCYKYYSMQHWWSQDDYDVNQAFLDYVSEVHPLWIITGTGLREGELYEILQDNYRLVTEGRWDYYRYNG